MIVSSFGLMILIQNLIALIADNSSKSVSISKEIIPANEFLGLTITHNQLIILAVCLTTVVIFELLLQKSKIGSAIRAVGQNKKLAEVIGIKADKVIIYTFFIASALSSIGATLYSLEYTLKPTHALHIVLKVVVACIIGGIGSVRGALAGGLILGISENIGINIFGSQWQDSVAYLLLILFLIFKPEGLFVKKLRE